MLFSRDVIMFKNETMIANKLVYLPKYQCNKICDQNRINVAIIAIKCMIFDHE